MGDVDSGFYRPVCGKPVSDEMAMLVSPSPKGCRITVPSAPAGHGYGWLWRFDGGDGLPMFSVPSIFRGLRAEFKAELTASQTRQQDQVDEIRETNKVLEEKVDRLIEVFLSARMKAA